MGDSVDGGKSRNITYARRCDARYFLRDYCSSWECCVDVKEKMQGYQRCEYSYLAVDDGRGEKEKEK
jgi:hypothetical protein